MTEHLKSALTPGQRWYRDNRETALPKAKERERKKRIALREQHRLTPEELAACLNDPTLAWTIRGSKWIACLECGALCESLGPHLRQCHHLTAEEYKAKPGLSRVRRYSKNASLTSKDLQAKLSKIRKNLGLGKRLQASGKVPGFRKLIASRGKRVLSQQYRLEQSRRLEGRPASGKQKGARQERQKFSDRQFLKIYALGLSDAKSAKLLETSQAAYHQRARKLHLDTGAPRRQQRWIMRRVSELRTWIMSRRPQTPTPELITEHLIDDLRSGLLSLPRELSSFITHLEAEFQERPAWIDELRVRGAAHKVGPIVMRLTKRLLQRMRARSAEEPKPAEPRLRKHPGPDKQPAEQSVWFEIGRKVEELIPSIGQAGARHQLAEKTHREYATIEQYHKRYRRWLKAHPQGKPSSNPE